MNEDKKTLLTNMFAINDGVHVDTLRFRADNYKRMKEIDDLVCLGYIEQRDHYYNLQLIGLDEINIIPKAKLILNHCQKFFELLHSAYLRSPGDSVSANYLAKSIGVSVASIRHSLYYLTQAHIFRSCSDLEQEDAIITPSESVLKFESFGDLLKELRSWVHQRAARNAELVTLPILSKVDAGELKLLLHPEIEKHSYKQFLDGHYRDAVLNSIIAVFDLIRRKTNLREDGDRLIGKAFSPHSPYLILSEIESESGQNDQKGFMQIFSGAYIGIRNPKSHTLDHDLTENKAAQYLVFASLLARRVDEAKVAKTERASEINAV